MVFPLPSVTEMLYKHSYELSSDECSTGGLAGRIPVRCHRSGFFETRGAHRARSDWTKHVGSVEGHHGGLTYRFGLMQVAVPECLPERLEVLAYASEIGFLYDDITEEYSEEKLDAANKLMEDTFKDCIEHDRPIGNKLKGLEIIQSSLFDEMRSIDEPRALVALGHWSSFLSEGAGRQHQSQFKGLDEYMDYRIRDVGEMFWLGLVTFGMGLDIPDAELTTIRELTRSCWVALCLQNDLCSYWKEAKDATDRGSTKVVNALPVIMEELKVDLDGAREMCRSFLEDQLEEYQQVVEEHKENLNLSQDSRTYLEALLFTISGDAAWSLISPRYNYQLNGRVQTA